MLKSVAITIYRMPNRAWEYGQRRPYEAIVYGLALAGLALVSKVLLALLACIVVASGVKRSLS